MNTKVSLYPSFSDEIIKLENTLKTKEEAKRKKPKIKEEELKTEFYEIKELIDIASNFSRTVESIKNTGPSINPAAVYDSTSRIKELGDISLLKYPQKKEQILPFIVKAENTMALSAKEVSLAQANSTLFDYYREFSDLRLVSQTMIDMSREINTIPASELTEIEANSKSKIKAASSGSILGRIKSLAEYLKEKITKIVDRTGRVIGEAGKELREAITDMLDWLNRNVVSKFLKAFKWLAEKLDQFKLYLYERMFDFVRKVVDLAEKKKWKIKDITVGMPEFGLESRNVAGYNIPIPTIAEPKVSFRFVPSTTQP